MARLTWPRRTCPTWRTKLPRLIWLMPCLSPHFLPGRAWKFRVAEREKIVHASSVGSSCDFSKPFPGARRPSLGAGLRAIARATGRDLKSVAKYVAPAIGAGLRRGDAGPTDAHVAAVLAAVHAVPVGRPGDVPDRLAPHREQIAAWLAEGLRLTKIYRLLRAQGVGVPYSSQHRFARAHLDFGAPSITVRVADPHPAKRLRSISACSSSGSIPTGVSAGAATVCWSRYATAAARSSGSACAKTCRRSWTDSKPPGCFSAGSSSGSSRTVLVEGRPIGLLCSPASGSWGSWGGRRPSLASYVATDGTSDGATTAERVRVDF
jgi:hypothetical protein